ncbi:MAG: hypothetical protein ACSHYA_15220 [Opitutaceae bacterium]
MIEKKNFLQSKIDQLGGALQSSEGEIEFQSLEDMIAHIERIARGLD